MNHTFPGSANDLTKARRAPPVDGKPAWHAFWRETPRGRWHVVQSLYGAIVYESPAAAKSAAQWKRAFTLKLDTALTMTFDQVCQAIVSDPKADPYAKAYADVGFGMTDQGARRVQAMYILSNLSRWRNPIAKEVRAILKEIAS